MTAPVPTCAPSPAEGVDTIAAIATGAGRAGIGIVRVSGPAVPAIARAMLRRELVTREATYLAFRDAAGETLDVGLAIRFEAPDSFTGEHVLELQGHGGAVVLDRVLAGVLALGARAARAGEFSERAFLNDKLDLVQAEAIADLIDSSSDSAARAALRSMSGDFSADIEAVQAELVGIRVWLEAALDFSEEEIDFLADPEIAARAARLVATLVRTRARADQGQRLRDGLTIAIAGRPNVGKSSLLNALAGTDSAIVTDVPGTTRDLLHVDLVIDGVPLHLVDTAGLRDTEDTVERIGVERARAALAVADHVLVMVDAQDPPSSEIELPPGTAYSLIVNKLDLFEPAAAAARFQTLVANAAAHAAGSGHAAPVARLGLSVRRGEGLRDLREHLLALAGRDASIEGVYLARRRHLEALGDAHEHATAALARLGSGVMPELAAEELRLAQRSLDTILGRFDADDLLGAIFSSFCIGK